MKKKLSILLLAAIVACSTCSTFATTLPMQQALKAMVVLSGPMAVLNSSEIEQSTTNSSTTNPISKPTTITSPDGPKEGDYIQPIKDHYSDDYYAYEGRYNDVEVYKPEPDLNTDVTFIADGVVTYVEGAFVSDNGMDIMVPVRHLPYGGKYWIMQELCNDGISENTPKHKSDSGRVYYDDFPSETYYDLVITFEDKKRYRADIGPGEREWRPLEGTCYRADFDLKNNKLTCWFEGSEKSTTITPMTPPVYKDGKWYIPYMLIHSLFHPHFKRDWDRSTKTLSWISTKYANSKAYGEYIELTEKAYDEWLNSKELWPKMNYIQFEDQYVENNRTWNLEDWGLKNYSFTNKTKNEVVNW